MVVLPSIDMEIYISMSVHLTRVPFTPIHRVECHTCLWHVCICFLHNWTSFYMYLVLADAVCFSLNFLAYFQQIDSLHWMKKNQLILAYVTKTLVVQTYWRKWRVWWRFRPKLSIYLQLSCSVGAAAVSTNWGVVAVLLSPWSMWTYYVIIWSYVNETWLWSRLINGVMLIDVE